MPLYDRLFYRCTVTCVLGSMCVGFDIKRVCSETTTEICMEASYSADSFFFFYFKSACSLYASLLGAFSRVLICNLICLFIAGLFCGAK